MVEPEVARARRLAQAHLTGPGLTEPRAVSSSEPRDRQSAEFESYEASGFHKRMNSLYF